MIIFEYHFAICLLLRIQVIRDIFDIAPCEHLTSGIFHRKSEGRILSIVKWRSGRYFGGKIEKNREIRGLACLLLSVLI